MNVEAEAEIEFLDEDADIVQQCFNAVDNPVSNFEKETELLVERVPIEVQAKSSKRRRKKDKDDSDYDPSEEVPRFRRKRQPQNFARPAQNSSRPTQVPRQESDQRIDTKLKRISGQNMTVTSKLDLSERKRLDIRVPDYDDPLCLPVRAIKRDDDDAYKLKSWNNLCLDKFKQSDKPFRVEKDETIASKRSIVLRNMRNSVVSGKIETTMYSKITVENKAGTRKTELIQSVLPRYREKKLLNNYKLLMPKKKTAVYHKTEVILTKNINKDEETLVVYNPNDAISSVYRTCERESDPEVSRDEDGKNYLKELSCRKTCAPCYQATYGGYCNEQKKIKCQMCKKSFGHVRGFVSHLKTHSHTDIRRNRGMLSEVLTGTVNYKCRICVQRFQSTNDLKRHMDTHKGDTLFMCEIGDHVTK